MKVEKVDFGLQTIFYNKLFKMTQTLRVRGVSIVLSIHSEDIATIKVQVSGRRGIVEKNIVLYHEFDQWISVCDGRRYYMDNFASINDIIRRFINRSNVIVSKI
jgi:hypothetical protein